MAAGQWTIDVSDRTFEQDVIERSKRTPVVVDFWAPWCAPCKTLGPLLERLAEEHRGGFVVAKVNVDENPVVARAAGVQSIPLVLGVRDGQVVSEFVGAQPETAVRQFLSRLLPSEADALTAAGAALAEQGDLAGAEAELRAALVKQPAHAGASLVLARLLGEDGRVEQAIALLEAARAGADPAEGQEIDAALAALRMLPTGAPVDAAAEATLRERLAREPTDLQVRLDLGRLLAAARRFEEALGELLEVVKRDRTLEDDAARKAMLDVFAVLGRDHPIAARYQRELSAVLFR